MLLVLPGAALAPDLEAAAIREENFAIAAGWNLIHIDGEPVEKEVTKALVPLDWTSLWAWVPAGDGESRGRWVVRHRTAPAFLDSLDALVGSTSYALHAQSAGSLRVRTYVRPRRASLGGGAFQLFGPALAATSPPTLAAYFSRPGVKEHLQGVYELAGGAYRRVGDGDALRPGAAYWMLADQDLLAPDPIRVQAGLGGLRFDSQTTLAEIELDVGAASQARPMTIRAVPSADGQSTSEWLRLQSAGGAFLGLGGGAGAGGAGAGGEVSIEVPPDTTRVRITLRAESEGVVPPGSPDQSAVVEVVLPGGQAVVGAELTPPIRQGLWIGEAVLGEVERPSIHGGGFAPAPGLTVSIILEIQGGGPPRLLPCLQVEAQRDGRRRTYRFEAALFDAPLSLSGALAGDGTSGVLTGAVRLGPEHPLNPYRHRYHPEHGTGYDLRRSIELRFEAQGPPAPGAVNPLATVGVLGGVYQEVLTGLSPEPIRMRGAFQLRQVPEGTAVPCTAGQ